MLGIIQARMQSTRLPGKVLKPILGRPTLERQIERVLFAKSIDRLVVATSTNAADDPVAHLCEDLGVVCFRGHPTDVLDRFHKAVQSCSAEHVVRLTGDCPLVDASIVDHVVEFYLSGEFDYASNIVERTYPDGLDVEVLRASALERAWRDATEPHHREHAPLYIRANPHLFRIGSFTSSYDLFHLRWTVDEPSDFEFIRQIYENLYPGNAKFSWLDVLHFLKANPEIASVNAQCGAEETRLDPRRLAS